jgi:predicted GIY-YIG superfamily endonuclease
MAQCWEIKGDKAFAMHVERMIKKLTRPAKEKIIADPKSFIHDDRISIFLFCENFR